MDGLGVILTEQNPLVSTSQYGFTLRERCVSAGLGRV